MKFFSGEIFAHPAFANVQYAWRIDSDVGLLGGWKPSVLNSTVFEYMCARSLKYLCPSHYDLADAWEHSGMLVHKASREFGFNKSDVVPWLRPCAFGAPPRTRPELTCLRACNCMTEVVDVRFFRAEAPQRLWRYLALERNGFYSSYFSGLPATRKHEWALKDHVSKVLTLALFGGVNGTFHDSISSYRALR